MKKKNILFAPQVIKNEAGGLAYQGTPKEALAQLASTSCLNNTLYCTAEKQLDQIIRFAGQVDANFIAKTALYSREKFHLKDVPALLCVLLVSKDVTLLRKIFPRVINNGDMLRNFFEMLRSGKAGRKSFGSAPKQLIVDWFNSRTPAEIFEQSVGTPSMRDILRTIRPRPLDKTRSAIYAWFVGKPHELTLLPKKVQDFEAWKLGSGELPDVPFQMLTNVKLDSDGWTAIARRAGWKWLLKNLNNMSKHGVFTSNPEMVDFVAERLTDRKSIKKSCTFPYQILTAYQHALSNMPLAIQKALHVALDVATENVPLLPEAKGGNPPVRLFVDVSGSMKYPVTGARWAIGNRANSSMTRADVAALIACSILRRNPGSEILLFNDKVVATEINPTKPVLENSTIISKMAKGDTACSAPMRQVNEQDAKGDLIVIVSDDQSWKESMAIDRYGNPLPENQLVNGKTALQTEWESYKQRNPNAKLICIDIAPYTTKQVQKDSRTLNIGGFSDTVFDLCGQFAAGTMNANHLVGIIEKIDINGSSCDVIKEVEQE